MLETRTVEPSREFEGKTALVIGGGTGIGNAIAVALQSAGARVISAGRRNHDCSGLISEIWDVTQIQSIPENVKRLIHRYDQIDLVVNAQGICPDKGFYGRYDQVDMADFELVMKTNLESVYFICQEFCKYFEKEGIRGHILNICSTEGLKGSSVPYGISKAGLIGLTKGWGRTMAPKGITVNGIAPGATATAMMRVGAEHNLRYGIPAGRMTTPQEIARAALLMLGDDGNQMCGQILVMDGGESL